MVTPQQIRIETNKAMKGSRTVRISFSNDQLGMMGVKKLFRMDDKGIIDMGTSGKLLLLDNPLCEIEVHLGSMARNFDEYIFSEEMCRALNKIEAV